MKKSRQSVTILSVLSLLILLTTFGCSSYPTKFGVLHGGHITREHAKPMEGGYYQNFDPDAVSLEVVPVEETNPVQTQHVLIATVKDNMGKPLCGRRVEWMIAEGSIGAIVEVDESGWYNTRGYKLDNKYAVTHTNYENRTITRGNDDPADDIVLTKGQTWCTITSPIEGTTNMVVYAPAIFNWDNHKVFVTKHWNDATWNWPPDDINPIGTPHEMEVKVMQFSDGAPIPNAVVNFRIIDGPDAHFMPDQKTAVSLKTDGAGLAKVRLEQVKPLEGVNTIEMEIIREQCGECNPPMKLASGTVTKTWVGPRIGITKTAPESAGVNDEFLYTITATNPGEAAATNARVTDVLPEGIAFVSSRPETQPAGQKLEWALGTLEPQQSRTITVTVKATRTGTFENCAEVAADYDLRARDCAPTVVTAPQLALEKSGPAEVLICEPITYTVIVRNTGGGPATNVKVTDELPAGLKTEDGRRMITADVGTLEPGQAKRITYSVTAEKPGSYTNTAVATGDRNMRSEATHQVIVRQPLLALTKSGPERRFVNRSADYDITVSNKGDGTARNTVLTDTLPAGMNFVNASHNGSFADGIVTWNLGDLAPNATTTVTITMTPTQMGSMKNTAMATASCTEASAMVTTDVAGIPAILLEVVDVEDPIEVGTNETYTIIITNQGSAVGTNIRLVCTLPAEQDYVSSAGPTNATADAKVITFAPLPQLAPKAAATYRLITKGTQAGDHRLLVELTSDQFAEPIMETESTNVYE